jgi:predicted PurR-regulated permease PerM
LWTQVSAAFNSLRDTYGGTPWGKMFFQQFSPPQEMQQHLVSNVGTLATSTIGAIATAFILIVTALYFAIAPDLYVGGVVRLFPLRYRPRAHAILRDIGAMLRRWSLGQLIDMCVVGVLTGIGLSMLGVPLALALAVLAGLFTFVPYFGAIAAAIPAALVGFTMGWQTSLWVVLIFLVCHGIDGYLLSPIVQRNTAHLPPALTLLSMTILGTLYGPLGVILGTPVAAALLVAVREFYVADVLGDPDLAPSEAS